MRAVRIHSFGASDELRFEETSLPKVHDEDLLVQVYDAGVNPLDWKVRSGRMKDQMNVSFPLTIGQDFAGEVLDVGQGALGFVPGDRVFGFASGAYAEFVAIPAKSVARIPEGVDYVTAAAIPTPGLTAWQALVEDAGIHEGQRILIQGAAGAVGAFAVQLSKWRGLEIAATARSDEFDYLRSIGADRLIDYQKERFEDEGIEYDVVLELVGGETLQRSYGVVKRGGVLIETAGALDARKLEERGIRGVQFLMRPDADQLTKVMELVAKGYLQPRVSRVLPLSDAREAQDLNQAGRSHGKIVLQVT